MLPNARMRSVKVFFFFLFVVYGKEQCGDKKKHANARFLSTHTYLTPFSPMVSQTIGDLTTVGAVLTRYFADKRYLSETTLSNPPIIAHLLSHLSPHLEGFSLAGAGGGGFLAAILKPGLEKDQVVKEVREAMALDREGEGEEVDGDSMWGWSATVDRQGLVVQVGSPCY